MFFSGVPSANSPFLWTMIRCITFITKSAASVRSMRSFRFKSPRNRWHACTISFPAVISPATTSRAYFSATDFQFFFLLRAANFIQRRGQGGGFLGAERVLVNFPQPRRGKPQVPPVCQRVPIQIVYKPQEGILFQVHAAALVRVLHKGHSACRFIILFGLISFLKDSGEGINYRLKWLPVRPRRLARRFDFPFPAHLFHEATSVLLRKKCVCFALAAFLP